MASNARKHTIPSGADQSITRATIFEAFGNSIRDIVPVANATERAQLVTALTGKGQGPSTDRPLFVFRNDAPGLHRVEYTENGTLWLPFSGVQTFATKAAADSFGTANGGLLSVGDEARINGVIYRWSGTVWYQPFAGARVSAGTDGSGKVTVTHGMGKAPASANAVIASDSPIIGHVLKADVGNITATTFDVTIRRGDQGWAPFAGNPVVFNWTAVA